MLVGLFIKKTVKIINEMKIPVIILLVLWSINLLIMANKHGQKREGKHSFWVALIGVAIQSGLLYWAGLFD